MKTIQDQISNNRNDIPFDQLLEHYDSIVREKSNGLMHCEEMGKTGSHSFYLVDSESARAIYKIRLIEPSEENGKDPFTVQMADDNVFIYQYGDLSRSLEANPCQEDYRNRWSNLMYAVYDKLLY